MKVPKALYSCHLCQEDYSWPPEDLFWSEKVQQWICIHCWDLTAHGKRALSLAEVLSDKESEVFSTRAVCFRLADELDNRALSLAGVLSGKESEVSSAQTVCFRLADELDKRASAAGLEKNKAACDMWFDAELLRLAAKAIKRGYLKTKS